VCLVTQTIVVEIIYYLSMHGVLNRLLYVSWRARRLRTSRSKNVFEFKEVGTASGAGESTTLRYAYQVRIHFVRLR
jgi:hypothetical protein